MSIGRRLRGIFLAAVTVLFLMGLNADRLGAQQATATISGSVTDPSGAAIPDAMVRVTNVGTGGNQNGVSDAQGRYKIADLAVGDYEVQVEKTGFQSAIHKGIRMSLGAETVVDFALPIGQVAQTVTVEGQVSQVETTSSQISNLVEQAQIRELPLNGRNFEQLILLAPGVQTIGNVSKGLYYGAANAFSVSGSRANGQAELMDDTDVNDYMNRGSGAGVLATSMGVDGIAEFQTLTNTYGAQFGGNGAVMNAVSKSGTNSFHGSVYEFFRNSALDARNFYDPPKITPFKRNQFGGTFGGPIKKDKMFFFVNYEGLRQGLGETKPYTVLDQNVRNGRFNGASACQPTGTVGPCASPVLVPGTSNYVNSTVLPILQFYSANVPLPSTSNAATGIGSIVETGNQPGSENYVLSRYDWTISSNDSIFARYLGDVADLNEPFAGAFNLWPTINRDHNQFVAIEEKHVFSSSVINTAHFGYSRPLETSYTSASYNQFQFYPPGAGLIDATISVSGVSSIGGATSVNPIRLMQNKYSFGDDVLWTKGAHTLRVGGLVTRVQSGTLQQFPGGGTWTFNSLQLFLQGNSSSFSGPIPGNSVTLTNGQKVAGTYGQRDFRELQYATYVQDDWKVRPTLTLNLGVRWSPTSNPWERNELLTAIVKTPMGPGAVPCSPAGTATCSALGTAIDTGFSPVHNVYAKNASMHNIDPRIGIAWDPFKDHKTSIRAGYGIFHAVNVARDYAAGYYFTPPWATGQSINPTFPNLNPATFTGAPTVLFGFNRYIDTTPYMQQWNLSVQREVMKNTVATLTYVGSHGVHLLSPPDENPPLLDGVPGAITLTPGQTLTSAVAPSLVCSGAGITCTTAGNAISCVGPAGAACSLASANGQALQDPRTGQVVFSNLVSTAGVAKVQQNRLLNPNFGVLDVAEAIGWSKYNSLQAGLVRRLTGGLQAQLSYTYSECTDVESGSWTLDGGTIFSNSYDHNSDKGWCSFQIRHNFIMNSLYVLPFKGNRLVEGWQVSGIFSFHTGLPINVVDGFAQAYLNSSSANTTYNRPNWNPNGTALVNGATITCNGNAVFGDPTNNAMTQALHLATANTFYINPACFSLPPVGELGNLGRNALIGPHAINWDASITKNTRISERLNIQFRAEFFNLLNNVNFGQPTPTMFTQQTVAGSVTGLGNVANNAGQISGQSLTAGSTQTTSRQIQFGLKLMF
jgi:hypothetical protein